MEKLKKTDKKLNEVENYKKIKILRKKKIVTERGITLIALVVTIIVLLILAGVSIQMLTGQTGILTQARRAKELTEQGEFTEQVQLAIMQAEMKNTNTTLDDVISELIDIGVISKEEQVDKRNGNITTNNGYTLEGLLNEYLVWTADESGNITKADVTLRVGDEVNYDPLDGAVTKTLTSKKEDNGYGDQTFNLESYTGKWKVLGVEDGKLMIISDDVIIPTSGGKAGAKSLGSDVNKNYFTLSGQAGYENGINELNKICSLYGQGKNAIGVRSINIEDINNITGYNPNCVGVKNPTAEQIETGEKYHGKKSSNLKYGRTVTYYWDEGGNLCFEYDEEGEKTSGKMYIANKDYFVYYDSGIYKTSNKPSISTGREDIVTLTSSGFFYYPETLDFENTGEIKGISKSSNEYKLLFGGEAYFIASSCMSLLINSVGQDPHNNYSLFYMGFNTDESKEEKCITNRACITSYAGTISTSMGVRAIVLLDNV